MPDGRQEAGSIPGQRIHGPLACRPTCQGIVPPVTGNDPAMRPSTQQTVAADSGSIGARALFHFACN